MAQTIHETDNLTRLEAIHAKIDRLQAAVDIISTVLIRRKDAMELFGIAKNTLTYKDGRWEVIGGRAVYYELGSLVSIKTRRKRTPQAPIKSIADPITPSVYLVRAIGTSRYKIGFTYSVKKRVSELRTASPFPLELIASRTGTLDTEADIHQALSEYHSHLEWFECDDEDHIKAVFMGEAVVN